MSIFVHHKIRKIRYKIMNFPIYRKINLTKNKKQLAVHWLASWMRICCPDLQRNAFPLHGPAETMQLEHAVEDKRNVHNNWEKGDDLPDPS